jgi:hypothetical protein
MTEQPKLLTEAEWRMHYADFFFDGATLNRIIAAHRQRGLIAEEPVDPLLVEAREMAARARQSNYANAHAHLQDSVALKISRGEWDNHMLVQCALAALRRGIEIGEANRKELTREMVAAAWKHYSVHGPYGVDGIHAALQEQLK